MADEEVLDEETTSEEEEVIEETEEVSEPSDEAYTVKLKDGTVKKFKEDVFNSIVEAHDKGEKWETKYHKKGEKLNKQQSELEQREKAIKGLEPFLKEFKIVKAAAERDPEIANALSKAYGKAKQSLDPAFQELSEKQKELEETIAVEKASLDLGKEFKDFSYDEVKEFTDEFSNDSMKDRLKFAYYAMLGSRIDDIKQEAKAEVMRNAKKRKGLPSTGKPGTPPEIPLSDAEAAKKAHDKVNRDGERWR